VVPESKLGPSQHHRIASVSDRPCTHLRLHIFPDGGVARLRVYGDVLPAWKGSKKALTDLAAVENGGLPLLCSDRYFSHPQNLIMPGRARDMGDGWETKRRRGPGFDWVILRLGAPGVIKKIEVDTNHFKGNFPESCLIEGVHRTGSVSPEQLADEFTPWAEILPRTKLSAHTRHVFARQLAAHGPITHARLSIFPDGGVSRLRLWGTRA
jgi:allantoicase